MAKEIRTLNRPDEGFEKSFEHSLERSFEQSFEQALLKAEQGFFSRAMQSLRAFLMRFSRRRKHRRFNLTHDSALMAKIQINGGSIDAALSDISEGGMGLEIPRQAADQLTRGATVPVLLSFDGAHWQESRTEVRHVRLTSVTRGYIGVEFRSPSPSLIAAIQKYRATRTWL